MASGDRVVWVGKDGQPTGRGTIARITVHEVEVRWDGEVVMRYRRAHFHNLRHVELISESPSAKVGIMTRDLQPAASA
jgi:hypothetical protein